MATIDFFAVEGKLELPDGMTSPYTRVLVVDPGGRADYTTIVDALDAINADGAPTTSTRWLVRLLPGIYAESFTIPSFVTVLGTAKHLTSITGSGDTANPVVTMGGRAGLRSVNVNLGAGYKVGIRTVSDIAGGVASLFDVQCNVDYNVNDSVIALQLTGNAANAFVLAQGCYFYADNDHSGASAKAVPLHIAPSCTVPLESFATHLKTSATSGAQAIAQWNQGTGTSAYFHVIGDWAAVWSPYPYWLVNENTSRNGAYSHLPVLGDAIISVLTTDPHANARRNGMTVQVRKLMAPATYLDPLELNGKSVWLDSSSRMRVKSGVPASDTDGSLVSVVSDPVSALNIQSQTVGQYYGTIASSDTTAAVLTTGTAGGGGFRVAQTTTYDRIGLNVTAGAAGATLRFLVYADDGHGRPTGTPLLDTSADPRDASTTGAKEATISLTLTAARYHVFAMANGGSPTVTRVTGADNSVPQQYTGIRAGYTLASGVTLSPLAATDAAAAATIPRILMRVSAQP